MFVECNGHCYPPIFRRRCGFMPHRQRWPSQYVDRMLTRIVSHKCKQLRHGSAMCHAARSELLVRLLLVENGPGTSLVAVQRQESARFQSLILSDAIWLRRNSFLSAARFARADCARQWRKSLRSVMQPGVIRCRVPGRPRRHVGSLVVFCRAGFWMILTLRQPGSHRPARKS